MVNSAVLHSLHKVIPNTKPTTGVILSLFLPNMRCNPYTRCTFLPWHHPQFNVFFFGGGCIKLYHPEGLLTLMTSQTWKKLWPDISLGQMWWIAVWCGPGHGKGKALRCDLRGDLGSKEGVLSEVSLQIVNERKLNTSQHLGSKLP